MKEIMKSIYRNCWIFYERAQLTYIFTNSRGILNEIVCITKFSIFIGSLHTICDVTGAWQRGCPITTTQLHFFQKWIPGANQIFD